MIRADHPSKTKRGGVFIYYRNFLPLKLINIHYLNECITFEIKLGDKICNFVSLYRSPNQSEDQSENICNNSSLATGILAIQKPLKALKLRP